MSQQRKPLVDHIFTADPSAHVFNGKLYIYPSHDLPVENIQNDDGDKYMMEDYHILSMDSLDAPCVDNGEALHMRDVKWVSKQMWAPDAAYKNGKYYLYFPARDKEGNFRIGVAVGDKPEGPFVAEDDYIQGTYSIDPAVFVDDDGRAYMYYGGLWGGQLEKWQTGTFDPDGKEPPAGQPAARSFCCELADNMIEMKGEVHHVRIIDENGNDITADDEDRRFFEASWMHKYNGTYYFSYSTGTTHYVCYATSDNPFGPFTYRGRILEPVLGWTTHHSIVEWNDKWYLFYHDCELSDGQDNERCVKFTELKYNEDGTIQTIKPYEE